MLQVRRTLARRRTRTVVDNLLGRAEAILALPPYTSVRTARGLEFWLAGRPAGARRPSDAELRAAIAAAAPVAATTGHGDERAPIVYSALALETLLARIAETLPSRFARNDLDRIFRALLTPWFPTGLVSIDDVLRAAEAARTRRPDGTAEGGVGAGREQEPRSTDLGPEESAEVKDIVERVMRGLDAQGRLILKSKLEGMSDQDVAARLGVSRPTAAKRKDAVVATLRTELEGVSERVLHGVVAGLEEALGCSRQGEP